MGCGEHRRGVGGPGHRAQPFPGASPARKRGGSWHRPVRTPLELAPQTAGHGPEGLQRAKKGVPRGAQTHHHIHHLILIFLPLPGAGWPGGCPRKGGSPGLEAGRPGRNPENKRRRRRLLRGQNNLLWRLPKARPWRPPPPKPVALTPSPPPTGTALAGSGGTEPGAPSPPRPRACPSSGPPPFPPGFRVDLPTHGYVRPWRVAGGPGSARRRGPVATPSFPRSLQGAPRTGARGRGAQVRRGHGHGAHRGREGKGRGKRVGQGGPRFPECPPLRPECLKRSSHSPTLHLRAQGANCALKARAPAALRGPEGAHQGRDRVEGGDPGPTPLGFLARLPITLGTQLAPPTPCPESRDLARTFRHSGGPVPLHLSLPKVRRRAGAFWVSGSGGRTPRPATTAGHPPYLGGGLPRGWHPPDLMPQPWEVTRRVWGTKFPAGRRRGVLAGSSHSLTVPRPLTSALSRRR